MINRWLVNEPASESRPVGCVIALPGRGIPGSFMQKFLDATGLWRSLQVAVEPRRLQWYPQPNGVDDQDDALAGLPAARRSVEAVVKHVSEGWKIPRSKIGLIGFSAGGVMVINTLAHMDSPLAGGVCMGGAILHPESLPGSPTKTPLIVQHNQDDDCFDWFERYTPMRDALTKQGYPVTFEERPQGGHNLSYRDVKMVRDFFSKIFGYYEDFEVIDQEEEEEEQEEESQSGDEE